MAKRNTPGRSSGRRGSSRNSEGDSSSRGRKSDGRRSFKKSDGGSFKKSDSSDDRQHSRPRGTRSSARGGESNSSGFKKSSSRGRFSGDGSKSSRPTSRQSFSKRNEGDGSSSRSSFNRRTDSADRFKRRDDNFSNDRGNRFNKSDKQSFEGGERKSSFGKKTYGKREGDGSVNRRTRSNDRFKDKRDSFSGNRANRFEKSDRESFDRGDRRQKFEKKPYKKSESEERGFFKKSKSRYAERPGRKSSSQDEVLQAPVQTEKVRLNKFIANSGVCSRREADELISMGLISVNGTTITELGYKVNPGDVVRHEDKVLKAEKPVYVLMNKPKGFLTTTEDPQERNTVMHIIGGNVKERIYPVGRLDRNTTGLLLLTNDGDLAEKLMHPSYNVKKIYKVDLDRPLTKADFQTISEGVLLEEGRAMVDDLAIVSPDGKTVGVEIHIGWNRVVRRIFEALQYEVLKLDRTVYAGLDKKDLGRGQWRFLSREEITRLKHLGAK